MSLTFEPAAPVLAKTATGELFPVRRVFCVGRNYAAHAREMGRDPDREPPFFFTKWSETVVGDGAVIAYPQATADFQYEAELVVAIGRPGRDITEAAALSHIWGYATGLDMTRRDLQLQARAQGRPWDTGKNVEASSPLGLIHPVTQVGHPARGAIELTVNGALKQSADLTELLWTVPEVVAFLSRLYRLEAGDLIYTGTPTGVGPVTEGDFMEVTIDGLTPLRITVGAPAP